MTGSMPDEGVNPIDFPAEAAHVWHWFLQLNAKRPQGFSGASCIPESEVHYFFRNRHIAPEVWEVDAISALDGVALAAAQKE